MALPPIISNSPLFKLFKTEPAAKSEPKPAVPQSASQPEDVVEISEAAQARLNGVQTLSEQDAPGVAAQTREQLTDSDIALGLDPNFQ